MQKSVTLPIAIMAFAIVAFLLLVDLSVNPEDQKTNPAAKVLPEVCTQVWHQALGTQAGFPYTCDKIDIGWHYDKQTVRCVYFNGSACSTSPFGTGEECGKTCKTNKIDPGTPGLR